MWRDLIREKRRSWDELVRTEDQAWYLLALCLVLLTAWAAWKAKYPWVSAGYGLMAVTILLSTMATWIAGRRREVRDRSLREHLEALMESYDRRARFVQRGGWCAMSALTAGLVAVVLGIPGNASEPQAWGIAVLLVAGAVTGQWLNSRHSLSKIVRKRVEAAQLLESLIAAKDGGGA